MTETEQEIRNFAKKIVIRRLLLKLDVIFFLFTTLLLFVINNFLSPQPHQWWLWECTGWIYGLIFHIFTYWNKGLRAPTRVNLMAFLNTSWYLLFIDQFSTGNLTWSWIPIIAWGILLIVQFTIQHDIRHETEEITIYGLIISDESGRVLIDVEPSQDTLVKQLQLKESNVEMVSMFINAIQQFSKEIHLTDLNNLQLFGENLKVIAIPRGALTLTAFISANTKPHLARSLLTTILQKFAADNQTEIEYFSLSGNCSPFESYRETIKRQLVNLNPIIS